MAMTARPAHSRWSFSGAIASLGLLASCTGEPTAPLSSTLDAGAAFAAIPSGAAAEGFTFLPPLGSDDGSTGDFDPDLATLDPEVMICDLAGVSSVSCGGSGAVTVAFTSLSSPAVTVDLTDGQYRVNWSTKPEAYQVGRTYRVRVTAGAPGSRRLLGWADVLLTSGPGQAKSGATYALQRGQTLPIKFRIGIGVPGSLTLSLSDASVRQGSDLTATATLRDLHGSGLAGVTVGWSASGAPLTITPATSATDGDGSATTLATAGATVGTASITATASGLSASASVEITPAVIDQATLLASMNDPRNGTAVAAYGGRLFAIGGWTNYVGVKATNEAYDPIIDQWTFRAPLPTARTYGAAAVVGGAIYVIGGTVGPCCGTVPTVEAYDPATDTWTSKAPLLRAREQFGVAVHNGIIYAIGGWTPDCCAPFLATVEAYDPATNTWTPRAPMPAPRAGHAVAGVNGKLYVVGGETGAGFQAPVFEYDPATDTWATKAAIPTPRTRLGAAAVNGILYAVGGWLRGNNGGVGTIEAYDPVSDSWTSRSGLNIPRWALGVVALNGAVYAVGGVNQILDVPQLEVYRP